MRGGRGERDLVIDSVGIRIRDIVSRLLNGYYNIIDIKSIS